MKNALYSYIMLVNTNVFGGINMGKTVTIRLNDEEKEFFEAGTVLYKGSLSTIIKRLAMEKLEDDYDMIAVARYEKNKKDGSLKLYSHEEMLKEIGLDDEDV